MKLFQTIDPNFSFLTHVQEVENLYSFMFTDNKGQMSAISFTEENFLDQFPATDREKTDSMNVYMVATPQGVKLVNKYAESYYSNAPGGIYTRVLGYPTVGQIYIPFRDSSISDWAVRLNSITTITPVGDFDLISEPVPNSEEGFVGVANQVLPNLEVLSLSPQPDGTVKCQVQLMFNGNPLSKSGIDVCAESDSGYISIKQLTTDQNGLVEFTFRRLDLQMSDIMLVNLGFKLRRYVTNVIVSA